MVSFLVKACNVCLYKLIWNLFNLPETVQTFSQRNHVILVKKLEKLVTAPSGPGALLVFSFLTAFTTSKYSKSPVFA